MSLLGLLSLFICSFVIIAKGAEDVKVHLRYFDSRGRGEPIRLLLAAAGVDYSETKFGRCEEGKKCPEGITDWPTYKAEHINTPILPFGQVPSLTLTDTQMGKEIHVAQSSAIQYFLAERFDLLQTSAEEDLVRTDVICGGLEDMRKKYGALVYNQDLDEAMIEKYKEETLKGWLPFFERLIGETSGPWFMGDKLTLVDTAAFDMLESNLRIDPACLDDLPKLKTFVGDIVNVENIKAYLTSSTRRPHANGNFAKFDTPNNPIPVDPILAYIKPNESKDEL